MRRVNVFSEECEYDPNDPAGYRAGAVRVTKALDAEAIAAKLMEIPSGESVCPYHYQYG